MRKFPLSTFLIFTMFSLWFNSVFTGRLSLSQRGPLANLRKIRSGAREGQKSRGNCELMESAQIPQVRFAIHWWRQIGKELKLPIIRTQFVTERWSPYNSEFIAATRVRGGGRSYLLLESECFANKTASHQRKAPLDLFPSVSSPHDYLTRWALTQRGSKRIALFSKHWPFVCPAQQQQQKPFNCKSLTENFSQTLVSDSVMHLSRAFTSLRFVCLLLCLSKFEVSGLHSSRRKVVEDKNRFKSSGGKLLFFTMYAHGIS